MAAIIALVIEAYGQGLWGCLAFANLRLQPGVPWAAPTMLLLLAGLMAYLAGQGWPRRTAGARRTLLRLNPVPPGLFVQAMIAGVLSLIALCGAWLVTSDLIALPRAFAPDTRAYPLTTALAFLIVASLAAPLSEEAAFRGYAQGLLERAWGSAPAAIVASSVLFAAAHFPQGLFLPKLGLYFLAGLIFGALAYLTNSILASVPVHVAADLLGFLLLWPHDARPHAMLGADPLFWPALAALVVATPLALAAFWRLDRSRRIGAVATEKPVRAVQPA